MPLTRAYCHLLADVHLAGFAPAFTLSLGDSEFARKPQDAHSLSRYVQQQKNEKERLCFVEKSLTNCPLLLGFTTFQFDRFCWF